MSLFTHTLLQWYYENKRNLPWRNETSPYKIWVSEIILQQTRVQQGWNYYLNFIETFPTIERLAAASEEEVLKVWQGLGYYSRARNMHHTARFLVENKNGEFPTNYDELRKLKGIGPYTAAAIASFAFNLPYPAIDGNVLRVISRYYGIFDDIAKQNTQKQILHLCEKLMLNHSPRDFNQALMEFGALQCVPKSPNCRNCPLTPSCFALINEKISELPFKINKIKIRKRFFHYLIFIDKNNKTLIQKRIDNDIWKNLYQFPLIETKRAPFPLNDFLQQKQIEVLSSTKKIKDFKHILTHQTIFASFYQISVEDISHISWKNTLIITSETISNYPMPVLISKSLAQFL